MVIITQEDRERLQQIRERNGLSFRQMACLCDVCEPNYRRWEDGSVVCVHKSLWLNELLKGTWDEALPWFGKLWEMDAKGEILFIELWKALKNVLYSLRQAGGSSEEAVKRLQLKCAHLLIEW